MSLRLYLYILYTQLGRTVALAMKNSTVRSSINFQSFSDIFCFQINSLLEVSSSKSISKQSIKPQESVYYSGKLLANLPES